MSYPREKPIKYWHIKRFLCLFGIHWEGLRDLGMYGDAAYCDICLTDRYGLKVLHQREE